MGDLGGRWRIEMFGGLSAVSRGRAVARFTHQKGASLLAYLACRSGPHPREALNEEAQCELMRLYAAAGETASALRQYRNLEQRFQEELGVTPSPATRALVREIKRQMADSAPTGDAGAMPVLGPAGTAPAPL